MLSRSLQFFIITFVLLITSPMAFSQSFNNQWESLGLSSPPGKTIMVHDDCEVLLSSSGLVIKVDRPLKVEIFTLLGKPVSAQILEPGNYSFSPSKHGVYIIKTQSGSCKVTL